MLSLLILLLALFQLQRPVYSELPSLPRLNLNAITQQDVLNSIAPPEFSDENNMDPGEIPFVKNGADQTEIQFRRPISAVNIDYSKNAILLKFQGRKLFDPEDLERRKALESNFMRFGRDQAQNFMRFGKRAVEQTPKEKSIERNGRSGSERFERSSEGFGKSDTVGFRDSRGDNFMRFGRDSTNENMRYGRNPGKDFMRFGRNPAQDYMRFGRSAGKDYMRFGRNPGQDYMRFGRSPGQDFMRFGRSPGQDYMRFGRSPGQDYMRFGRSPGKDYMRFGRSPGQDYMRFGRNPGQDYMRFGRSPADFLRLGRNPSKEFMRFGRAGSKDKNFIRFGRLENFMRFGRNDPDNNADKSSNFMRFGRMNEISGQNIDETADKDSNHTTTHIFSKNDIKDAAKIMHEADTSEEESNPVDKAIQALFSKQEDEQTEQQINSGEDSSSETEYQP